MCSCKSVRIIVQLIWCIFRGIVAVMHNQRCQCGILDLDAGLVAFYSLLNGKGCHSAKKLLQCFLTGNKVAKGVVDQHVVTRVICKVAIWLEHIRIGSDHNVNTLLHKEVGPFFFVFGRHWFFGLAPVCRENHTVCGSFGLFDGGCNIGSAERVNHRAFSGSGCICTSRAVCISC